jgi:tRNA(His) 5'-end guanylyltransferase
MQETAKYLCENIQGCKIAYIQSDEITLLLTDYENIDTQGWFEYNIQKMVSISASMATLAFNTTFKRKIIELQQISTMHAIWSDDDEKYLCGIENKIDRALFEARVFSISKEEVCNCFIWRQQDATRNSIQMVGQANFSFKELQNKSCNMIQEMLFSEKGINWNNYATYLKRGSYIIKEKYFVGENNDVERSKWVVDKNVPIFTEDRDYIDKYVF